MTDFLSITIVIFLAGVGVLGDYFIKLAGDGSKYIMWQPFFIGAIVYMITIPGWFYIMKHIKLGSLGMFYSLTTAILLVVIGTIFFKEQLNIVDIIGIILGVTSIILLARFG